MPYKQVGDIDTMMKIRNGTMPGIFPAFAPPMITKGARPVGCDIIQYVTLKKTESITKANNHMELCMLNCESTDTDFCSIVL